MAVDAAHRFQNISKQARPWPSYLLEEGDECLAIFAAGFLGWNDAVHFARAGLTCGCVDTDEEKLLEMKDIYPDGWSFYAMDAWDFAERAAYEERQWDVVTVDPFFDTMAERAAKSLPLWVSLTRRILTLTVKTSWNLSIPLGCKGSIFPRSGDVAWLVVKRDGADV